MTRYLDQFAKDLQAAEQGAFRAVVLREMKGFKFRVDARAKLNATTSPRVRSNRLRSSITTTLEEGPAVLKLELSAGGPNAPYAGVQEEGGTIKPKGQYLAIPLAAAKTGAGDIKGEYAGGWRSVTGAFVLRADAGNLYIARADTGGLTLLAKLVRSVTLRPTHFLKRAIASEIGPFRERVIAAVKRLLETGSPS